MCFLKAKRNLDMKHDLKQKHSNWMLLLAGCFLMFSLGTTLKANDETKLVTQPKSASNDSKKGPNGGELVRLSGGWSELLLRPEGVRIYLYTPKGKLLDTTDMRAQVRLVPKGARKSSWYDLYPEESATGSPTSLFVAVNLAHQTEDAVLASFYILGMPGEPAVTEITQALKVFRSDAEIAIAAQETCPVSGKRLGLMGKPVKSSLQGKDVYLCCSGCVNQLKSHPEKYLANSPVKDGPPVKATKVDAVAISTQKLCPVMDEPLDAMGGPWRVTVKGKSVYVCCEGCIESVQDEPDLYIAKTKKLNKKTVKR